MPGATFDMPDAFAAFGVRVANGAMTAGGSNPRILTSATAVFTQHDVGKKITVEGAGAAGADLTTTIARRISATQVELKDPALTTVAGSDVSYVKGVYRLSNVLNGPDVAGNTYQFMGQLGRLRLSLGSDSPGGSVFVGGPYVSDVNYGVAIGASGSYELSPPGQARAISPSSEYVTSGTAAQKLHIFWTGNTNQSTPA